MEKICQSCAMPMSQDQLGTNADGSINADYCKYCFVNGEFIDKVSMEEYIEKCVPFSAQANMTGDQMRKHLQKTLPNLKRWKNKGNN